MQVSEQQLTCPYPTEFGMDSAMLQYEQTSQRDGLVKSPPEVAMAIVEREIIVHVPVEKAYQQWANFAELPRFLDGVSEVQPVSNSHLHWRANVEGKEQIWDAEITQQIPNELISWRSVNVNGMPTEGSVEFSPVTDVSTLVTLKVEEPSRVLVANGGDVLAITMRRVEDDLQHFKDLVEGIANGTEATTRHGAAADSQSGNSSKTADTSVDPSAAAPPAHSTAQSHDGNKPNHKSRGVDRRQHERRKTNEIDVRFGSAPNPNAQDRSLLNWRRWTEELNRLVTSFTHRSSPSTSPVGRPLWMPQVDATERDGKLYIATDLPGVDKSDVRVEINKGILTLWGERHEERHAVDRHILRYERHHGRFTRSIRLPKNADVEHAQASFDNGVLQISIPTPSSNSEGQQIEVHSS
jgi:HSP20 family molecular chaperone IbpA/uncharacterized membrane protein